ncbi:TauD/TfdA family dioxygenase [Xanthomonas albilineans]|nr:TauD/TfdA family dioxygenase [Xanthomonas albilineans]
MLEPRCPMHTNADLPLTIKADSAEATLTDWNATHRATWPTLLWQHRALLFRGFAHPGGLEQISRCFFDERLAYTYRSTPRTDVGQHVYTATEYPRQLSIAQHCENAYQRVWPMKLLFHCVQPASEGGCTPLADMLKVTAAIDPQVREIFARKQVRYVRNYRAGVDLPWEDVFNTRNKQEVEAYCARNDMQCEWTGDGLRTSQICRAFACHPATGDEVWFNQAHLFHYTALEAAAQKMMLSFFGEQGLPRNAYFGDGTPIDPAMLDHVRTVFAQHKIHFDWHRDDVLLIDNMLVSHGREPYEGSRKILVCMAEPYSPEQSSPDIAARSDGEAMLKLHV